MSPLLPLLLSVLVPPALAGAIQLSLYPCDAGGPTQFSWSLPSFTSPDGTSVVNLATSECVAYDPVTTNLLMETCAPGGTPDQTFVFFPNNLSVASPSRGLCWDSQYYGNSSGSLLGLYECAPNQVWDQFSYDTSNGAGHITNTQNGVTLCVNGGPAPVPLPSPSQLAWTRSELSLMISYDLITQLPNVSNPQHFCINAGGDSGFPVPPPSLFNPSNLSTDSWIAAAVAANATYTLLVASHCSGFLSWPSNVSIPRYGKYDYSVASSPWLDGKGDIVEQYVASSRAANMPFAFYLTWNYNYLFNAGCCNEIKPANTALGQINLTLDEFHQVMLDTIEEVWSRYPSEVYEIWFDGGENNVPMNELIERLQPTAIVTDGTQGPNYARLVGKESGYAPYPVWSTATAPAQDGSGDPAGTFFVPAEADTPIAANDAWFWKPAQQYRPLAELQAVYLNTVGANSVLELGVLPDDTGSIPADQMALLQSFGDWIRRCHSPTAALAATSGVGANISLTFPVAQIDRVILQEDQSQGQLVQAFEVYVDAPGGYAPVPVLVASGTAIGNKRILYFQSGPIAATRLTVFATTLFPSYTQAYWRNVAVYAPCE